VLNPIHNVQPDVPPQNLLAMIDACREYGQYPV
jgi:uroporphyrinogen-III decarboxylase